MSHLVPIAGIALPAVIAVTGERAAYRFLEFFTAHIRDPPPRRAYATAVGDFCHWTETQGLASIAAVTSVHVATYIELLGREVSAPTVKQHLAAIRSLFDWLATGGVLPFNPAAAVRGPRHAAKRGKTPVLVPEEARQLLDAIDISTPIGLRDRALIGLMVYPGGTLQPEGGGCTADGRSLHSPYGCFSFSAARSPAPLASASHM